MVYYLTKLYIVWYNTHRLRELRRSIEMDEREQRGLVIAATSKIEKNKLGIEPIFIREIEA